MGTSLAPAMYVSRQIADIVRAVQLLRHAMELVRQVVVAWEDAGSVLPGAECTGGTVVAWW